jgi:chemotaxis signal transduction protein
MNERSPASDGRPWLTPTAALTRAKDTFRGPSESHATPVHKSLRYGFRIGPLGLLVAPDVLTEVLREMPVFALPGAPRWIAGLLNLRGNLVPVFDLHGLFGFADEGSEGRDIVALDRGAATVCTYVDCLPERVAVENQMGNIPPLPEQLRDHVAGAFSGNGSMWLEFSHTGFFRSLASVPRRE